MRYTRHSTRPAHRPDRTRCRRGHAACHERYGSCGCHRSPSRQFLYAGRAARHLRPLRAVRREDGPLHLPRQCADPSRRPPDHGDEAQITSDLSAIWTQGTARLIDGENIFCSEAIYARPFEGQAYFFGTRCKLKRPGLAIDSDSIEYRWQDKIGVFDGHVLYIDSDGEKAFVHLEYDFNKNKIA